MENNARIYVARHRGLVGSAIVRRLGADGYSNILTRTHGQLDLMDQGKVRDFFSKEKPEYGGVCVVCNLLFFYRKNVLQNFFYPTTIT